MVTKRGMLAVDEIIKLILGVAVFIFILFVLFFFGKMVSNTLHEEQAKNVLDNLVYELKGLKEGQDKLILIEGPAEWFFYSHANKLCFLPYSCLSQLTKDQLLTPEQIDAGMDNVIPLCQSQGSCSTIEGVSIPYDYINYKTGYVINYLAQIAFGSSELVRADIFHALLIGKKTIPQTVQIRNVNNKFSIRNVPSTKELPLMNSLISTAKGLQIGGSSKLDFSGAEKRYLSAYNTESNLYLICLCGNIDKNICNRDGLCTISELKLILSSSIRMPSTNPMLSVTRDSADSFSVTLIK